jgi:hypothetical protein
MGIPNVAVYYIYVKTLKVKTSVSSLQAQGLDVDCVYAHGKNLCALVTGNVTYNMRNQYLNQGVTLVTPDDNEILLYEGRETPKGFSGSFGDAPQGRMTDAYFPFFLNVYIFELRDETIWAWHFSDAGGQNIIQVYDGGDYWTE